MSDLLLAAVKMQNIYHFEILLTFLPKNSGRCCSEVIYVMKVQTGTLNSGRYSKVVASKGLIVLI